MSESLLASVRAAAAGNADPAPVAPVVHRVDASADQIAAARAEGEAAGRTAERARVSAILTAEAASGRGEMAHHLAFETDMSADAAVALLAKAPTVLATGAAAGSLAAAMANEPAPARTDGAAPPSPGARAAINPSAVYAARRQTVERANGAAR